MKLADFAEVSKIEKGWSHEQKYKVTDREGKSFLLRLSSVEQYEQKKAEFENMQMVSSLGIPMCQPIEFGMCEEGVYSLQSWIEGRDAQSAPSFASGMVDGYFGGDVPLEFWNLLALYICSNTLSSLPWAIPYGEGEIAVMQKQAKEILEWYDNMKNTVPKWYAKQV